MPNFIGSLLALCLLAPGVVSAQNAPAGRRGGGARPPALVSPEVHPDRTVTFRVRAASATNVTVAGEMPDWVRDAVLSVDGVRSCDVNLVFDPPWDPSRMSDEAKLQLNMF